MTAGGSGAEQLEGLASGERVGAYVLGDPIGEGGMGVVYRAHHLDGGADVALKILRAPHESLLASFRREIQALRSIRHPFVVEVLADGVFDGRPWYAMPLIEGRTLGDLIDAQHLGTGPVSSHAPTAAADAAPVSSIRIVVAGQEPGAELLDALGTVRGLCEALAYVHGRGLVHRDLKPDNVVLGPRGAPTLVDFGLARRLVDEAGREVLDFAATAMGTPGYMAPEQIRGESLDARADLYALGCILYELCAGCAPFEGRGAKLLGKHVFDRPAPPSRRKSGIDPALDMLILKLLAKEPRDRIGYATDVARALGRLGAKGPAFEGLPDPRPYLYRPRLSGRHEQVGRLQGELLPRERGGGAVWLGGESGVGKTRLAMELSQLVARRGNRRVIVGAGFDVALGAGSKQPEPAAPLHPFRPLLLSMADRCRVEGASATERIFGDALGVLIPIEPSLRQVPGAERVPAPALVPAEAARDRILDAMVAVLGAFAREEPLLLVLDDIQWADELSVALLRRLDEAFFAATPLSVIGTYRSDEVGPSLRKLLSSEMGTVENLERLDGEAVRAMVEDMLALDRPPEPLIEFLFEQSDGNPFFIAEYLRAAIDVGLLWRGDAGRWQVGADGASPDSLRTRLAVPGGLRDLVARRVDRLGPAARRLLEVASVVGGDLDSAILVTAARFEAARGTEALAELRARRILGEDEGGALRFVHRRMRELVFAGIDRERRPRLHAQVATAIETHAREADQLARWYPSLAHHFDQAGQPAAALRYLELAGRQALDGGAHTRARSLYERALELCGQGRDRATKRRRGRLRHALGEACYALGDLPASERHNAAALELLGGPRWSEMGRPRPLRVAWASLGALADQGLRNVGVRRRGAADAVELDDLREAYGAAERLSQTYLFLDRPNLAFGASLVAAQMAERLGPSPELARAYATLSVGFGYVPLPAAVAHYGVEARAIADACGDQPAIGFVNLLAGLSDIGRGHPRRAIASLRRALDVARATGHIRLEEEALALQVLALRMAGDAEASLAATREGQALFRRTQNAQAGVWSMAGASEALERLGRLDEAAEERERALRYLEPSGDRTAHITIGAGALVHFERGEYDSARRIAERTLELAAASRVAAPHTLVGLAAAADVLIRLAERTSSTVGDERRALIASGAIACDALDRHARSFRLSRGTALLMRGLLERARGDRASAARYLREALDENRGVTTPFVEARVHWELAETLPPTHQASREHRARAKRAFEKLGAKHWIARC